jgi:molybdopterin synthase catalytic subunit
MKYVSIQQADFDPGAEQAKLEALNPGAIAGFTGLVRGDDGISAMTLEHYPGMTEAALNALANEALGRWPLKAVVLIHRIGRMTVGERIVQVTVASDHRAAALEACAFLIDRLKTNAPFWKQEEWSNGKRRWVEAKGSDDVAAERWDQTAE